MPGTSRRRKIPRRVTFGVLALLLVLSGMLWARPIETHAKTLLLLSEVFPQAPVKPLSALTDPPVHRKIEPAVRGANARSLKPIMLALPPQSASAPTPPLAMMLHSPVGSLRRATSARRSANVARRG